MSGLGRYQQGNVLLVCLSLMLIMTIWGVSATRTSSLSIQANQNARFKQISFEAAEFALRQGEALVRNEVQSVDDILTLYDGASGRFSMVKGGDPTVWFTRIMPPVDFDYKDAEDWLNTSWPAANLDFGNFSYIEIEYNDDVSSSTYVDRQPRILIEYVGTDEKEDTNVSSAGSQITGRHVFRINAIGWGPQGLSTTVLRSHLALAI